MRVVGYYRSPPADGESSDSPAEQPLDAIKRFCLEEFHQLIATVPPAEPAQPPAGAFGPDAVQSLRPGTDEEQYGQLIQRLSAPSAGPALVVIPDSGHLAADLEQLARRVIEIEACGGAVRCADPDSPDPMQDSLERLSLTGRVPGRQSRIREAIFTKAARGEVLGRLPFGYRGGLDGTLSPLPHEAEIVAGIFNWYLGPGGAGSDSLGDGSNGMGFRKIAARLNEQGSFTRAGNRWSPAAVAGVLKNRAYIGTYSRQGIRLVANHTPIVDRKIFNRVQEVLGARQPARRVARSSRFPLRGLLRCAECGSGVHGLTRSRRWTRADGTPAAREYRYYQCPVRPPPSRGPSEHAWWRAERLEAALADRLAHLPRSLRAAPAPGGSGDIDPHAQLKAAERDFMRQYRSVAAGHERVKTLEPVLAAIESARAAVQAPDAGQTGEQQTLGDLIRQAASEDAEQAAGALRQIIQRIDIGVSEIEITLRP